LGHPQQIAQDGYGFFFEQQPELNNIKKYIFSVLSLYTVIVPACHFSPENKSLSVPNPVLILPTAPGIIK